MLLTRRDYVLHQLHNGVYLDDLVGDDFRDVVWNVLSKRERAIVFLKVDGLTDKDVCDMLHLRPSSFERHLYLIRSKYRNRMNIRVDDTLRQWKWKHGKT